MDISRIESEFDQGVILIDEKIAVALGTIHREMSTLQGFFIFVADEAERKFASHFRTETKEKRKYFTSLQVLERKLQGVVLVRDMIITALTKFAPLPTSSSTTTTPNEKLRNPNGETSHDFLEDAKQLFESRLQRVDHLKHRLLTEVEGKIDFYAMQLDGHLDTDRMHDIESAEKRRLFTKRESLELRADVIAMVKHLRCSRGEYNPNISNVPLDDSAMDVEDSNDHNSHHEGVFRLRNDGVNYADHSPDTALGSAYSSNGKFNNEARPMKSGS